jgi:hypothetical protein
LTLETLVLRDLDPRPVARQYESVLAQLRRGDFRSAQVKKLRGSALYRAKLDDKSRLLFKLAEHGGRTWLLVLEIVLNHDYAKARFLNGGAYGEDDFEPVPAPPAAEASAEKLVYVNPGSPALHFLDKPLSFDDAQTAVFETPLPLIVIGSAGSGKTALTLEKLKTIPGHGLYLTRSPYLVENARSLYHAQGYENAGQEVEFLALAELLETIEVPRGREATWADFAAWYARMRGLFRMKDPHRIHEEIKGVLTGAAGDAPWLTEAEYLELGVRQSIFLGEERRAVYAVFERWLSYLRDSGLYDANVAAWERRARAEEVYDFLVVDEVQDITTVELRLALATLKDKRQFLLCGDSNQIVHPNLFSWARVKSVFYGEERRDASPLDRIHVLSANYRNTRAVTALANRLLVLKQRRFGSIDRESNFLVESVGDETGRVDLLPDTPEVRAEIDGKTRRSTRTAVVVLRDEDKPPARAAFQTPLVFSVQEAKGLEYENVVVWNVVSAASREFRDCTEGVVSSGLGGELTYARARDKTDKSLDAYKFYVNALYVALTRAVKSLLLVEREADHPIWDLLAIDRRGERIEIRADESSREEWQREARYLELQGKLEQAEQIRREILETAPVPWAVIDAASLPAVRARAAARDKAAQQLLFEYALTYDAPGLLPELLEAGFRHARNPASGRAYIESSHYAEYAQKRPQGLRAQLARHGLDFRNPLNETPLMVAARMGRADLVEELLAEGADPDLVDTAGRTALRVALAAWLEGRGMKRSSFADVCRLLATRPIKVKVGARMTKLDPSSMEWFLLNLGLVLYRRLVPAALERQGLPAFKATALERTLASLPDRVLPPRRKQRSYVSSVLAKNEAFGKNPYNRHLFFRVAHGYYVLNPALDVERQGSWLTVGDAMGLPLLLDGLGPADRTDYLRRWMEKARERVTARPGRSVPEPARAAPPPPPGSPAVKGEQLPLFRRE